MPDIDDVIGLVGVKAITYYGKHWFSPIYGGQEWLPGMLTASCIRGCISVPSEKHLGCGFHAFWEPADAKEFVDKIFNTETCLVLIECFGKVVIHEKGLRAQKAKIVGVIDWNPKLKRDSWAKDNDVSVCNFAARDFNAKLVNSVHAREVIDYQRNEFNGTDSVELPPPFFGMSTST